MVGNRGARNKIMLYATFNRMRWDAPRESIVLERNEMTKVSVRQYAPTLTVGEPAFATNEGTLTMKTRFHRETLPEASYFILQTTLPSVASQLDVERARTTHAELATSFALAVPGILERTVWEGVVQAKREILLAGAPQTLGAAPFSGQEAELRQAWRTGREGLAAQALDTQASFTLAARWYSRAAACTEAAERLLYAWLCLEIFPGRGARDVPAAVAEYVHQTFAPRANLLDVRTRLGIDEIAVKRREIVANGLTILDPLMDPQFAAVSKRLDAIVTLIMRSLCGLPPGPELKACVTEAPVSAAASAA